MLRYLSSPHRNVFGQLSFHLYDGDGDGDGDACPRLFHSSGRPRGQTVRRRRFLARSLPRHFSSSRSGRHLPNCATRPPRHRPLPRPRSLLRAPVIDPPPVRLSLRSIPFLTFSRTFPTGPSTRTRRTYLQDTVNTTRLLANKTSTSLNSRVF